MASYSNRKMKDNALNVCSQEIVDAMRLNQILREKLERALISLEDMVTVAESQGWENAEIQNAREILANNTTKGTP